MADPRYAQTRHWRFQHLFVDEFQDVNPLQYQLLRAWLGPETTLCVVGDPNQAIYSWNGADAGYLERFEEHFPGGQTVELRRNFRSTPQILAAAAAVQGEAGRLDASRPDGAMPSTRRYDDDRAEALGIARQVRDAHRPGRPLVPPGGAGPYQRPDRPPRHRAAPGEDPRRHPRRRQRARRAPGAGPSGPAHLELEPPALARHRPSRRGRHRHRRRRRASARRASTSRSRGAAGARRGAARARRRCDRRRVRGVGPSHARVRRRCGCRCRRPGHVPRVEGARVAGRPHRRARGRPRAHRPRHQPRGPGRGASPLLRRGHPGAGSAPPVVGAATPLR